MSPNRYVPGFVSTTARSSKRAKEFGFCPSFCPPKVPGSTPSSRSGCMPRRLLWNPMVCSRLSSWLNAFVLTLAAPMNLLFPLSKRSCDYALGKDSSAPNSSLSPAQTTYAYRLAKTGTWVGGTATNCYPAGSDQDCVGDNWIPSLDNNWQDYYDAEFRGFNDVTINGPASGEMRIDAYFSTKGWGTSHSDGGNYNSGHLYEEDVYGPYGYLQMPVLLNITTNTYTSNPNSCFGSSLNAVYNPCEVMITKSR